MTSTLTSDLATAFNWTVQQGTQVQLSIPVLDSAGAAFAVSGWTVDAEIKSSDNGGYLLYSWPSGAAVASGTNVTLTILPATSLGWYFISAWYRVVIQHPTDATQRYRILQGRLSLSLD